MSVPLVSVILPVFNAASSVARAVESIRRQSFTDWECIVVDDGSTDDTRAVLDALTRQEHRMRVLTTAHRGIVSALNTGLDAAGGAFIARMDADDECHPDRFNQQVAFLRRQPEVGLVGSLVEFGGDRGSAAGYALHVDWMNGLITAEDIARQRFIESPFAHPSVVFRRELAEKHGGYREGAFPEDYELWLRWLEGDVVMGKVPQVLLKWNDPPARLSRQDARYDPEAFYRCKAIYLARWLQRHVSPHRSILVWGAGRPTRKRAELLTAHGIVVGGYIDVDPGKIGNDLQGRKVISPAQLPDADEVFVLGYVAKRGAREFARSQLCPRGFVEGRDFLMAA